jgi:hypothetical protein
MIGMAPWSVGLEGEFRNWLRAEAARMVLIAEREQRGLTRDERARLDWLYLQQRVSEERATPLRIH